MSVRSLIYFILLSLMTSNSFADDRPNIVIIMADDLGYSDLGCYGGEIETPHINQLAKDGLQFSHFRATPMCVTSRIALMAGMTMHRAGSHSYSKSAPLPIVLKQSGYRTMMTGKWHAGIPDPRSREIFDRSFGFLGGATDSFAGGNDWFLDDKVFSNFPKDFYSTNEFAIRSIDFMKESIQNKEPFFLYVAFDAPHHPCQAPKATVDKYFKKYMAGYQMLRQERHKKQIELGLINPNWEMAKPEGEVRKWSDLSQHRKNVEAKRMAAYAAAVDHVDQAVGKIMSYLKEAKLDENTFVVFLSDNGGDYNNGAISNDEKQIPWKQGSNPSSSNGWAYVKSTPFRYYKHACHEGGLAAPMIIHWPAGIKNECKKIVSTPTNITDFYPTILDLANAKYPKKFKTHKVNPLAGVSLIPLLKNKTANKPRPMFSWFNFSRSWIENEMKAVSLYGGPWQLFDLQKDRGEVHNLATKQPELLNELVSKWKTAARKDGLASAYINDENHQQKWGWHRINMITPSLVDLKPQNGTTTQSTNITIELNFKKPIDFNGTPNRKIQLFSVTDESKPVWEADPTPSHTSQGQTTIVFKKIPKLKSDHHYSIRWNPGWIRIGGTPVGPLNDGAYWWRFRTPK